MTSDFRMVHSDSVPTSYQPIRRDPASLCAKIIQLFTDVFKAISKIFSQTSWEIIGTKPWEKLDRKAALYCRRNGLNLKITKSENCYKQFVHFDPASQTKQDLHFSGEYPEGRYATEEDLLTPTDTTEPPSRTTSSQSSPRHNN